MNIATNIAYLIVGLCVGSATISLVGIARNLTKISAYVKELQLEIVKLRIE